MEDIVEGFIKVADSNDSIGEIINVGSNQEISIGDLAHKIISLIGRDVKIVNDEARFRPEKSEVEQLMCNNAKARKILDWEPKVSLDEGLKKTIDWISENMEYYKPDMYTV